ncbi:hypothetical protein ACFL1F_00880 [Chlamydiota bacterium]
MAGKIICPKCNQETFIKKEKVYQGFTPIGDRNICAFCNEEIDEDKVKIKKDDKLEIFDEEKEKKVCRLCRHYVVNPWTQKCVLHKKYVEALDSCGDFIKR